MTLSLKSLLRRTEPQAFPGDTYLSDMRKAAETGKPWAKRLILAVVLGFFADLYFLHDTTDIAFDNAEGSFLSIYSWIVAGALVLLYLFIGHIAGKKLRDFKVFRIKSSLASAVVALLVLAVALIALTIFRLSAEIEVSVLSIISEASTYLSSDDYWTEVSKVFVMTLVMMLSAFVSALHAYYDGDAVSEAVYHDALSSFPKDLALYNKAYFEHSNNAEKERKYETEEWSLDKRAVESAFRLGSLASQLNGIVDAADAHDFLEVQRTITAEYFNKGAYADE